MSLEIVRADPSALEQFLKLPWTVYRGDRAWAPPSLSDQRVLLHPAGPFLSHAHGALFLAMRDGRPVARVGAFLNHRMEAPGLANFGFFEALPDSPAVAMLLRRAEDWLGSVGARRVVGPLSPSINEVVGFWEEGEPGRAAPGMPYNPLYYGELVAAAGYRPGPSLLAYRLPPAPGARLDKADLEEYLELRQACQSGTYAYATLGPEERRRYLRGLKRAASAGIWDGGRLVAGAVALGDRLLDVSVAPSARGQGLGRRVVAALLTRQLEYSWVIESNLPSRRLAESLGGRVVRRYGLWERDL